MVKGSAFTVFVNSCDSFRDCWVPFFRLLGAHYPSAPKPVILNSERIAFDDDEHVVSTMVSYADGARHLTWSEATLKGLFVVNTELVLYLQEDYFISNMVEDEKILRYVALMGTREFADVACIQLTTFGSSRIDGVHIVDGLFTVPKDDRYRASLQASLWRTDSLRMLLRRHENAWQFEIFGSIRSKRFPGRYLAVARTGRDSPIMYVKTGIIKGKWYAPAVVALFARFSIAVNFGERGFFDRGRGMDRLHTLLKVLGDPVSVWRSLR